MSDTTSIADLATTRVLNDMQLMFIEEYLVDLNATQAAIRAGYSKDAAAPQAWRLLRNVNVARVLKKRREELAQELEITQQDVIMKLMQIAERAMEGEPVMEFNPKEKKMVPSGEWQFDGKTAHSCWQTIARILGYMDDKSAGSIPGGDFVLNIYPPGTSATTLNAKPAVTIEQKRNG